MEGSQGHPGRHLAFAAVALGTFMSTLDSSVVNIALPTLAADFGSGIDEVEWVVLSYLLTLITCLLNAGRLSDLLGRRWTYMAGLVVFGATSALCGLSSDFLSLSFARAGQGVGGALMAAVGPAILTDLFPANQRGRVLGTLGLAVSLGLASGPAIGGLIISALSWHWIFFINVPIAAFAAVVAFRVIPQGGKKKERFDIPGSLLLGGTLLCFLLAITRVRLLERLEFFALLGAAVVLLYAFIFVERRVKSPVVDLTLFRNRVFSGSAAAGFLVFVSLGTVNLVMPFYLTDAHGLEPWEMGWLLAARPIALALVSPFSGSMADRLGSTRGLAVGGALAEAFAFIGLSLVAGTASLIPIIAVLALLGFAMGVFQSPNNSALMGAVPKERLGTAGGLLATVRVGGVLVGNAVGGAVYLAASSGGPEGAAAGLAVAAFVGALAALLAAGASLARGTAS